MQLLVMTLKLNSLPPNTNDFTPAKEEIENSAVSGFCFFSLDFHLGIHY